MKIFKESALRITLLFVFVSCLTGCGKTEEAPATGNTDSHSKEICTISDLTCRSANSILSYKYYYDLNGKITHINKLTGGEGQFSSKAQYEYLKDKILFRNFNGEEFEFNLDSKGRIVKIQPKGQGEYYQLFYLKDGFLEKIQCYKEGTLYQSFNLLYEDENLSEIKITANKSETTNFRLHYYQDKAPVYQYNVPVNHFISALINNSDEDFYPYVFPADLFGKASKNLFMAITEEIGKEFTKHDLFIIDFEEHKDGKPFNAIVSITAYKQLSMNFAYQCK